MRRVAAVCVPPSTRRNRRSCRASQQRHAPGRDRPEVQAAVVVRRADRALEGIRRRRGHRDRQAPGRHPRARRHQKWDVITAGSWNDRWDVSVGSMTDTIDREELFYFTPAYYYTPASIVRVHSDNTTITGPRGPRPARRSASVSSTTYQDYVQGTLKLGSGAPPFEFQITGGDLPTFDTDTDALDNLALGDGARCDAAISAQQTIQAYIDDGGPIKIVGDPLYYEPLCIAFDKNDPKRLAEPGRGRQPDHRRHARRRHALRAVEEVVRRRGLDGVVHRPEPSRFAWANDRHGSHGRSDGAEEHLGSRRAHRRGIPQAKSLLFASWVILLQGALIALFLPILVFSTDGEHPARRHRDVRARGCRHASSGGGLALRSAAAGRGGRRSLRPSVCGGLPGRRRGPDVRTGGLPRGRRSRVAAVVLLVLGKPRGGQDGGDRARERAGSRSASR